MADSFQIPYNGGEAMSLPADPQHPLWHCVRWAVTVLGVTVVLWANASDFVITEGKAITSIGTLLAVAFTGEKQFFKHMQKQQDGK